MKFPVKAYDEDRYQISGDARGDNVFRLPPNDASVVIWTTTPWTIPANRAISLQRQASTTAVYEVEAMETGLEFEPWAKPGDRLIVADKLAEDVFKAAKIANWRARRGGRLPGHGLRASAGQRWTRTTRFHVPLLAGDHVTDDAGTGFVHTAPGHGADDYLVWLATTAIAEIPETVDPDGAYYPHVPLFGGLKVLETEGKKAGKFGPANARGDGQADRGRPPAGAAAGWSTAIRTPGAPRPR